MPHLKRLQHLSVYSDSEEYIQPPSPVLENAPVSHLPPLKTLRYHTRFSIALVQLLTYSAGSLQYVDIHVGILDLKDLMNALATCKLLRRFSLTLILLAYDLDIRKNRRIYTPEAIKRQLMDTNIVDWSSKDLEYFRCETKTLRGSQTLGKNDKDGLWFCFYNIFMSLQSLAWVIPIGRAIPTTRARLPKGFKIVANLTHFSATCEREFKRLTGFIFTQLRSLALTIGESVVAAWEIDAQALPVLEVLSITFQGSNTDFKLLDFPSLMKITIITRLRAFNQGMRLCISLLREPTICPRLEQINLDTFVEWDLLYLSIRKRNLLESGGLSRIKRLHLPSMPSKYRDSFAFLLGGIEMLPLSYFLCLATVNIQEYQTHFLDEKRLAYDFVFF